MRPITRRESLAALAIIQILGLALTYVCGRDLNWDQFNYHLYAGLSVFQDRFAQDFFPASIQTYLNPLAYAPFYVMVHLGFHSFAIGMVHALVHALNPMLLYFIARQLLPATEPSPRFMAGVCAALGCATAVFVAEFGTTFMDLTTSVFVLAAVLLLIRHTNSRHDLWWAGVLLGVATGLKLTNIVYAVATFVTVIALDRIRQHKILSYFQLGVGILAGFVAAYGVWGWKLWRAFGSPFFPYFNSLFKAPDFPPVSMRFDRFIPSGLSEWLLFPLRLTELRSWHYTEIVAADLRPIVILVVALVALIAWLARRRQSTTPTSQIIETLSRESVWLLSFAGVSAILWLVTSANGRYGIPLLLLLGPVAMQLFYSVVRAPVARVLLILLTTLQAVHTGAPGWARWNQQQWTATWFEIEVPKPLTAIPSLYLSLGMQSHSFVAEFVHPDSGFINLVGQHALSLDGPGGPRLQHLLAQYRGRLRVLAPMEVTPSLSTNPNSRELARIDAVLDQFLLRLDLGDCLIITADGGPQMRVLSGPADSLTSAGGATQRMRLLSCGLKDKMMRDPILEKQQRELAHVFSAFETKCPRLFRPRGALPNSNARVWTAHYMETDILLTVVNGILTYRMAQQPASTIIGPLSDWQNLVSRFACEKPQGEDRTFY